MQLATTTSTIVPLNPPIGTKRGLPSTQSVLVTDAASGTRFPGTGYGLGSWMQLLGTSRDQAIEAARVLASYRGPLAVVELRRPFQGSTYGAAPLMYLQWQQQGYGGHFRESRVREGQIGAEQLFSFVGKGPAFVSAIVESSRVLTPAPRR